MKKVFGVALLALPLLAASARADGWPFTINAGGNFYIQGANASCPQAGPWYLYWPLEAHFVLPAPTGYPYWPGPQVLPKIPIGPQVPAAHPPAPPPAAAYVPTPAPAPAQPPARPPAVSQPVLQPTSYYTYPFASTAQVPSYWYGR